MMNSEKAYLVAEIVNKYSWEALCSVSTEILEHHLKATSSLEEYLLRTNPSLLTETTPEPFSNRNLSDMQRQILDITSMSEMNRVISIYGLNQVQDCVRRLIEAAETHAELNIIEYTIFLLPPEKNESHPGREHILQRLESQSRHPENGKIVSAYEIHFYVSLAYLIAYQMIFEAMYEKRWLEIIEAEGGESSRLLNLKLKKQVEIGKIWLKYDEHNLYDEELEKHVLNEFLEYH